MNVNAASLALFEGDTVLLIRRAFAPYKGLWTLPGGRREPEESPVDCAVREVEEELDLRAAGLVPVSVVDAGDATTPYRLQVFATRTFEGTPRPSEEIMDWGWYLVPPTNGMNTTPDLDLILVKAREVLAQTG